MPSRWQTPAPLTRVSLLSQEFLRGSCQNVCALRALAAVDHLLALLSAVRGCSTAQGSTARPAHPPCDGAAADAACCAVRRTPAGDDTPADAGRAAQCGAHGAGDCAPPGLGRPSPDPPDGLDAAGARRALPEAAGRVARAFMRAMRYWREQIEPHKRRADCASESSGSDSDEAAAACRCGGDGAGGGGGGGLPSSNASVGSVDSATADDWVWPDGSEYDPASPPHRPRAASPARAASPLRRDGSPPPRPASPYRAGNPVRPCSPVYRAGRPESPARAAAAEEEEGDSEVEEVDGDACDMAAFFAAAHVQLAAARAAFLRRNAPATAEAARALRQLADAAGSRSVSGRAADVERRAAAAVGGGGGAGAAGAMGGADGVRGKDLDALEQQLDAAEAIWRSCNIRV